MNYLRSRMILIIFRIFGYTVPSIFLLCVNDFLEIIIVTVSQN